VLSVDLKCKKLDKVKSANFSIKERIEMLFWYGFYSYVRELMNVDYYKFFY